MTNTVSTKFPIYSLNNPIFVEQFQLILDKIYIERGKLYEDIQTWSMHPYKARIIKEYNLELFKTLTPSKKYYFLQNVFFTNYYTDIHFVFRRYTGLYDSKRLEDFHIFLTYYDYFNYEDRSNNSFYKENVYHIEIPDIDLTYRKVNMSNLLQ